MLTVDSGLATGVCLTYDALGRVVEEGMGSTCTTSYAQYVYAPSGQKLIVMNGQTLQKALVPLAGGPRLCAKYNARLLSDHLAKTGGAPLLAPFETWGFSYPSRHRFRYSSNSLLSPCRSQR